MDVENPILSHRPHDVCVLRRIRGQQLALAVLGCCVPWLAHAALPV